MAGAVPLIPLQKFTDANGKPLALGWVTVYLAGTTTLAASFQDEGLSVLNTNPVHLDANGEALIWLDDSQSYKFLLQDKNLVTVSGWPVDDIPPGGNGTGTGADTVLRADLAAGSGSSQVGFQQAGPSATAQAVQDVLRGLRISVTQMMLPGMIADTQSGAPVMDHTAAIEAALVQAESMALRGGFSSSGGTYVHLPAGQYRASKVKRRSGVALVGDGSRNTTIMPIAAADPGIPAGLLEIEAAPVVASHLVGMTICGASTPTGTAAVNAWQWGLYSRAQWDAGFTQGGLWHSIHQDVVVRAFNKCEWSRAGYTNAHSKLPNQFNTYINCDFQACAGGEARRFTGQHGQIMTIGGDCGGLDSTLAARAYTFDWDPDPSTMAVNASGQESTADVAGSGNAVRCPELMLHSGGSSVQRANTGVYVRNTRGVHFWGTWFEGLGYAFELVTNGGAFVANSRFANAADGTRLAAPSAGNGALVKHGSATNFGWGEGNFTSGVVDSYTLAALDMNTIERMTFENIPSRYTNGKTNVATPPTITEDTSGAIDVKGHDFVYARADPGDLTRKLVTITSEMPPGKMLTIRAWTGPITLGNTGNIRFGQNNGALTIAEANYITLRRVWATSGVEWIVVSNDEYFSDTAPVAGYWTRGTKIWKISASPAGSPGWITTTSGIAGAGAVFTPMPVL